MPLLTYLARHTAGQGWGEAVAAPPLFPRLPWRGWHWKGDRSRMTPERTALLIKRRRRAAGLAAPRGSLAPAGLLGVTVSCPA